MESHSSIIIHGSSNGSSNSSNGNISHLVGGIPTPLKNDGVSSSVGMMTFPIYEMESHKIPWSQSPPTSNVSNNQPPIF